MKELIDIDLAGHYENPNNLNLTDHDRWLVVNIYNKESNVILQKVFTKRKNEIPLAYFRILSNLDPEVVKVTPLIPTFKGSRNILGIPENELQKSKDYVMEDDPYVVDLVERSLKVHTPLLLDKSYRPLTNSLGEMKSLKRVVEVDSDTYQDYFDEKYRNTQSGFITDDLSNISVTKTKTVDIEEKGYKDYWHSILYNTNKVLDNYSKDDDLGTYTLKNLYSSDYFTTAGVNHIKIDIPHKYAVLGNGDYIDFNKRVKMISEPIDRRFDKDYSLTSPLSDFRTLSRILPINYNVKTYEGNVSGQILEMPVRDFETDKYNPLYDMSKINGINIGSGKYWRLESIYSNNLTMNADIMELFPMLNYEFYNNYMTSSLWNEVSQYGTNVTFTNNNVITSFELSNGDTLQFLENKFGPTLNLYIEELLPNTYTVFKYKAVRIVNDFTKNLDLPYFLNMTIPSIKPYWYDKARWRVFAPNNAFKGIRELNFTDRGLTFPYYTNYRTWGTFKEEMRYRDE